MKKARSNPFVGAMTLKMLAAFLLLSQGCAGPFDLNDTLRDRFDDAEPNLVISDDGSVLASGPVEAVARESFAVAGADFEVAGETTFLDSDGQLMDLAQVEVGIVLEVDGVQRDDGTLKATFAEAVGAASQAAERVVICHIPPGNPDNARTKSVGANAVAAHLGHGDHEGACTDQESGDDGGDDGQEDDENEDDEGDDEEKVTICHVPPGNPDNARTLTIGISSVQDHLDHGDYEGECIDQGESGDD